MKILLIGNWYGSVGGIENYIHELAVGLGKAKHEVVIASDVAGPDFYHHEGWGQYTIPGLAYRRVWSDGAVRQRVRAVLDHEKPDVAYVHNMLEPAAACELSRSLPTLFFHHTHDLYCPAGSKLLQRSGRVCPYPAGVNCVVQAYLEKCHSRRPWKLMESFLRMSRGRAWAQRVDGIVVDSRDMKERLIAEGFKRDRIWIIPTPVHIPESLPDRQTAAGPPTVLFAGRLTPHKGLRYLLEAMTIGGVAYRLIVAGDGYSALDLKALAKCLRVQSRVDFLGLVSRERLDALYESCHVVVMPSVWPEPLGMVGQEAMAHGKPVVAFDVGGIPEWLEHGRTGFLVPPRDAEKLAEYIDQLISDQALAQAMGAAGRARAVRTYSIGKHIHDLCAVLEKTIQMRREIRKAVAASESVWDIP